MPFPAYLLASLDESALSCGADFKETAAFWDLSIKWFHFFNYLLYHRAASTAVPTFSLSVVVLGGQWKGRDCHGPAVSGGSFLGLASLSVVLLFSAAWNNIGQWIMWQTGWLAVAAEFQDDKGHYSGGPHKAPHDISANSWRRKLRTGHSQ